MQYITANVTAQPTNSVRTRLAYNNSWNKIEDLLASLNGLDPAGTNYGKDSVFPNWSVSGDLNWVPSQSFVFGVRGGYRLQDQHDSSVTEQPRYNWTTTNNIDYPRRAGRRSSMAPASPASPRTSRSTQDKFDRAFVHADGTGYFNGAGTHQVKFGVQFDRTGNEVLSGEARPRVTLRWNSALSGARGKYGYYSVRSQAVNNQLGFITEGNIHSNSVGLFIQDAWTINNRLTVNLGLRTEKEQVPTYTTGADIPEFGVEFGFKDKLAPRVSVAYDLKGDGRTKIFGTWGIFYDFFKLELPRGSFGGDKWLEDLLHARHLRLAEPGDGVGVPAGVPGHVAPDDRLPSPLVRGGCDRAGPEADEAAGVLGWYRPRAAHQPGRGRALRPQADRPRHRGHGLA